MHSGGGVGLGRFGHREDRLLAPILYIGSAWSASWSVSGWMACRLANLEIEERSIFLSRPETKEEIKSVSPSGRVPALVDGDNVVWDSLAIAEYLWELNPDSRIWPKDRDQRWYARCLAAEVHAQFEEIRVAFPMNLIKRWPIRNGLPAVEAHLNAAGIKGGAAGVAEGLRRMEEMWRECRAKYGADGPYLFGSQYNFVDALFAPMVSRYVTYGIKAADDARAYIDANMNSPLMTEWMTRAEADAERVGRDIATAFP